jgi:hypothetical protein
MAIQKLWNGRTEVLWPRDACLKHFGVWSTCDWHIVAIVRAGHVDFTKKALKDADLLLGDWHTSFAEFIPRLLVLDFNSYRIRREAQSEMVFNSAIR